MSEPRDVKIKRLHMRSIRRGIKEMDLILTAYATQHMPHLSDADLDVYDDLLAESDHDIYGWITKQENIWKKIIISLIYESQTQI